jgi:hypothetical protein
MFTKIILAVAALCISTSAVNAEAANEGSSSTLSLSITHLLPSAYVIPSGELVIGTDLAMGLFGVADVSTNLYYDAVSVYNVSAKISLWQGHDFAAAIFATYTSQNINTLDPSTGQTVQTSTSSIAPGGMFSYRILDDVAGHVGASFVNRTPAISKSDLPQKSAYIHGTTLYKEFSFGLSSDFALVVGGTYDATYDYWGAGLSLHLSGVEVGAHYFFNVAEGQWLPILGVGYAASY